jgi:hypothetical protein
MLTQTLKSVSVAALVAMPLAVGPASATELVTEYAISFAGIPVARSKFTTTVKGDTVTVRGSMSTAGLATMFASTKANSVSEGRLTSNGVETQSFSLDYKSGKNVRKTNVVFQKGNVTRVSISPERKPNPNAVPIEPDHLLGVVDPFFASLINASSPADVCNRTIKVFDGVSRSNLVMRPSGSEPVKLNGTMVEGVRCAVRYQPISGHRNNSSGIRYMSATERATIVFVPLAGTSLYGPAKASIKTKNGTVSIRATSSVVTGS